jgi:phosphatidylinositol alpha 1,6-mannosyltransferase
VCERFARRYGNAGGVTETVVSDENGLLVPPRDAAAMADAIVELLASRALRQRLGAEARRRAEARTWTQVLDGVIASYRAVVAAEAQRRLVA